MALSTRLRTLSATAAFTALLSGCTTPTTPSAGRDRPDRPFPVAIADGRIQPAANDHPKIAASPPMQQAHAAAQAYWRGRNTAFEDDYRVIAVAEGSFTRRGARQQAVLYQVSLWPRCCPNLGLAVIEHDRLVRNIMLDHAAQSLRAVGDLDGDELDELVLTGSFGMGGDQESVFRLLSFQAGTLTDLGGASIGHSSCATGSPHGDTTALLVHAEPGPEFSAERFQQACGARRWRSVGEPQPLSLDLWAEAPYLVPLDG